MSASLGLAVTVVLLVHRCFLSATEPPDFSSLITRPPTDSTFIWYPVLCVPLLVTACASRSLPLVVRTQGALFVGAFLHVLWIAGTVPKKVDVRFLFILLTGHAVAWTSFACAVAALIIGLRGQASQAPVPPRVRD